MQPYQFSIKAKQELFKNPHNFLPQKVFPVGAIYTHSLPAEKQNICKIPHQLLITPSNHFSSETFHPKQNFMGSRRHHVYTLCWWGTVLIIEFKPLNKRCQRQESRTQQCSGYTPSLKLICFTWQHYAQYLWGHQLVEMAD